MAPALGQIVIFASDKPVNSTFEHPAMVTRVWGEGDAPTVNLLVFFDAQGPEVRTSVQHVSQAQGASMSWKSAQIALAEQPARDAEAEDNAEPGALAELGWSLDEVQDFIAPIEDGERKNSDIPRKALGTVYAVTDTTVERAQQRGLTGLADLLRHLQALRQGVATADDPRIFLPMAGRYEQPGGPGTDFVGEMVAPWPNTVVFLPGVKDEDVLPAFKWRVEDARARGVNPNVKFPGKG